MVTRPGARCQRLIGSNLCKGDFRLKLESSSSHHPLGSGVVPLRRVPCISNKKVGGMKFPLLTCDRMAVLWLEVQVNRLY